MIVKSLSFILAAMLGAGSAAIVHTSTKITTSGTTYEYYMPSTIGFNEDHHDLIQLLKTAEEGDTIRLQLGGYGGQVNTAQLIVNMIKESKATVIVDLLSGAYSAHAIISCAADDIQFRPNTFLMFHTVQSRGGAILYKDMGIGTKLQVDDLFYKNCSHLLTKDEIDNVVNKDYEYYITSVNGQLVKKVLERDAMGDVPAATIPKLPEEIR